MKNKTKKNKIDIIEKTERYLSAPAERWQHSDYQDSTQDERNPLKIRRVLSAADTLRNAGAITQQEHDAYNKYRYHYESALCGFSTSGEKSYGKGDGLLSHDDIRIISANALRQANNILDKDSQQLMYMFAIKDLRYQYIQEYLRTHPDADFRGGTSMSKIRRKLVESLQILAQHYSGELYKIKYEQIAVVKHDEVDEVEVLLPRNLLDINKLELAINSKIKKYEDMQLQNQTIEDLLCNEFGRNIVEQICGIVI